MKKSILHTPYSAFFILTLFLLLIVNSCKPKATVIDDSVKDDGLITVKFVQVNDVYEIAPLGGGAYGGMARVAYVADSIKQIHNNTMLVMAGDFLNPSLLGTMKVDGERLQGKHMIEVMNAMDFDLVTFGNHEFDIGLDGLQKRLNESNFPWISGNVLQQKEVGTIPFVVSGPKGVYSVPKTVERTFTDKDGTQVKLGFFSVTISSNPRDFVHYADPMMESQRAYQSLKPSTDAVVGLTHLALAQDLEVAKMLPELPLIMGGHEHNAKYEKIGTTTIAKADANAKSVYVHTLTFNKNTGTSTVDSELLFMDDRRYSDPEVKAIVQKWNVLLEDKIKEVIDNPYEVIYTANPPLDGTDSANRSIQTNLGEKITAAMKASYNGTVEAALVNGGSIRIDDMLPSKVSSMDIFRTLPFGGSVVKVNITGELLKKVLDYGKSKAGTGAYLQRHNITENPTYGWNVGNNEIETEKVYRVAFSDFLLKGYDIPFLNRENVGVLEVYDPVETETAHDIRKALIEYFKSVE